MKKTFISFLIITLMLTNISLVNLVSVQAATTDSTETTTDSTDTTTDSSIEVSLENIRDIMLENNLDIKIQHKTLEIANDKFHVAKDAYDDAKTAYDDACDAYDTAVATYDAAVAAGDTTVTSPTTTAKSTAKTNLDAAEKAMDTARETNNSAKTTYDQAVETKVYAAQTAYIEYLTDLSNVKLKEDTVKIDQKENQVYKLQYENGFLSKNAYNTKIKSVTSDIDLKKLKDAEELAKTTLCNTLGLSAEENVKFNTDLTKDFETILKINYDDDLDKMLGNNIAIDNQNDTIDDLEDSEDDYDDDDNQEDIYDDQLALDNAQLKKLINEAQTDFKAQYDTLMNSYNSIKNSYDQLVEQNNSYKIMEAKLSYGFVSQKEVDNAKLSLDTNESALQTKKNELYVNYLHYLQMREGY